ncbi:hypothetical protein ACFSHR_10115 [Azotobacter chroococcum]
MADALFFDGSSVNAADFTPEAWEGMKSASAVNPQLFTMACCGARAVLKTSIYGVQFFAHYSDECATAPETQWHVAGKDMVMGELRVLGIQGVLEKTGGLASTSGGLTFTLSCLAGAWLSKSSTLTCITGTF